MKCFAVNCYKFNRQFFCSKTLFYAQKYAIMWDFENMLNRSRSHKRHKTGMPSCLIMLVVCAGLYPRCGTPCQPANMFCKLMCAGLYPRSDTLCSAA